MVLNIDQMKRNDQERQAHFPNFRQDLVTKSPREMPRLGASPKADI